MNRISRPILAALLSLPLLGAAAGCSDIDNASDCNRICDRYRSCFNTSYNTSACYDRCQARGTSNDEERRRVDTCAACINGLSCAATVFTCGAQCTTIVP